MPQDAAAQPAASTAGAGATGAAPVVPTPAMPKGVSGTPAGDGVRLPRPQSMLDWVLVALLLVLLVVLVETVIHCLGMWRTRRALALRAAQRTNDLKAGSTVATAQRTPRTETVRKPSARLAAATGHHTAASSRQPTPGSGRHTAPSGRMTASGRVVNPLAATPNPAAPAGEAAARLPAGFAPFRIAEIIDETATVKTFRLLPAPGAELAPYHAGQYLLVAVVPAGADQPVMRCYSLSDAPGLTDGYRITVKSGGLVSGHLHGGMSVGDLVQVRKPTGKFIVDPINQKLDVALIAGGIGITPLWAMARALIAAQSRVRIDLFFGVRTSQDVIFARQLHAMAAETQQFRLHLVLSQPPADGSWQGLSGHVDVDLIRRVLLYNLRGRSYFICGPTQMMTDLTAGLEAAGVARDDIRTESFGGPSARRKSTGKDDEDSFAPSSETAREAVAIFRDKDRRG